MCSTKSDASTVSAESKQAMRVYKKAMRLTDPRLTDIIDEFDSPLSATTATIWPNLIVQREMNTLEIRQIVPAGPNGTVPAGVAGQEKGEAQRPAPSSPPNRPQATVWYLELV
jgi:hypothetical protein